MGPEPQQARYEDWTACAFRRAARNEAALVAALLVDAYRCWKTRGFNPKAASYTADDVIADLREDKEIWVLECDGRIVGTATLKLRHLGGATYFYVTHVATPTAQQGRGLGSEVMRRVDGEVGRRNVHELRLDTAVEMTKLVQFYQRRGFVAFEEPFKWDEANTYWSQKFRKELDGGQPDSP